MPCKATAGQTNRTKRHAGRTHRHSGESVETSRTPSKAACGKAPKTLHAWGEHKHALPPQAAHHSVFSLPPAPALHVAASSPSAAQRAALVRKVLPRRLRFPARPRAYPFSSPSPFSATFCASPDALCFLSARLSPSLPSDPRDTFRSSHAFFLRISAFSSKAPSSSSFLHTSPLFLRFPFHRLPFSLFLRTSSQFFPRVLTPRRSPAPSFPPAFPASGLASRALRAYPETALLPTS